MPISKQQQKTELAQTTKSNFKPILNFVITCIVKKWFIVKVR